MVDLIGALMPEDCPLPLTRLSILAKGVKEEVAGRTNTSSLSADSPSEVDDVSLPSASSICTSFFSLSSLVRPSRKGSSCGRANLELCWGTSYPGTFLAI